MATPKFDYPNTTSPTVTYNFERGGLEGDLEQPAGNQITDESEYGEIMTRSRGTNYSIFPFTFQVQNTTQTAPTPDVDKINTFFKTTVNFSQRPFYYTDYNSVEHKVKFIGKKLDWKQAGPNYQKVRLLLREVE